MNWDVTWPAVIAVAALALGIYNTVQQRLAPGRERQRQLWEDLRSVLEPLPGVFTEAQSQLQLGSDVTERPAEVSIAETRLEQLGPRFVETGMHSELALLSLTLRGTWLSWRMSVHHQEALAAYERRDGSEVERDRESVRRERDAAHRTLSSELEKSQAAVKEWIKRLDERDRGGPRRR